MKPLITVAAIVLSLAVGAVVWVYVAGTNALRAQAREQGLWIYTEGAAARPPAAGTENAGGKSELSQGFAKLFKHVDDWALKVTLATATTSAGVMLSFVLGIGWWRQNWVRRVRVKRTELEQSSRVLEESFEETRQELDRQVEARNNLQEQHSKLLGDFEQRVQQRVQTRTAELQKTCTALEKELNDRKQAEKSLTFQQQELVRSKDVLEMHVQARTQELQKLQRRYEHILNSAGEGIYGLDLQGRTTFVNPAAAKLTGWTVEDLIGKQEGTAFHHQPTAEAPTSGTQILNRNGILLAEQIFYRKDGTSFPVEYIRSPIMEMGRTVGAVVIFKDITERKRADETLARKAAELSRSNAELEQFAYVASHDLQEPLRKIQAFGDRLKTKVDAVKLEDGRDYLDRMQSAAARMQTLISDLLTFSRVISSVQPFVAVDLGVITKEVLGDLEVGIEKTKAKVEVGDLPTIDADPLQMRQLLQNLISNSLKFQPAEGQPVVKINAQIVKRPFSCVKNPTPDDEVCELTVQDNGIGFDEQYLEKIFAVFQRLHGRSEYEGTGVGLAVCRRITERHGGTITGKSKPGEGATFTITLPVHQANGEIPT